MPSTTKDAISDAIPLAALLIGVLILAQTAYMLLTLKKLENSAQSSGDLAEKWLKLEDNEGAEIFGYIEN